MQYHPFIYKFKYFGRSALDMVRWIYQLLLILVITYWHIKMCPLQWFENIYKHFFWNKKNWIDTSQMFSWWYVIHITLYWHLTDIFISYCCVGLNINYGWNCDWKCIYGDLAVSKCVLFLFREVPFIS